MTLISKLDDALEQNGLALLGGFELGPQETLDPPPEGAVRALLLIGNAGSALWPHFQAARAARTAKGETAPSLDQWTKEVIEPIAAGIGAGAVYPFEGPPFHPFTRWAMRCGTLFRSPLGLTVHPVFGLWHAFRAALLLPEPMTLPVLPGENPCSTCLDRPCLRACPVEAFSAVGYDFERCLDHLAGPGEACRELGCLARSACPVGQAYRYRPAHAAFHQSELLRAHGR